MVSQRVSKLDHILAQARPKIAWHWASCIEAGLGGFSAMVTARVDGHIETYFEKLKALPDGAPASMILGEIEALFRGLSEVNAVCGGGLLETDERELLVPIIIEAAAAAGLNTEEVEDGDPTLAFRAF
jgi:hypothetical protein